ncbi:MAG: sulfur carrier protein ThiS adenylyltransferase ThiF [Kiritimatiellae bacterium]|nr:sulfur carrier protein ThiS adenylyltransferase ThiF [Kiritimatiellia bacterium]MBQ9344956.1 sulfur carrier protein ThiS adenylyltransferase ThiF [Kiritimatiellia bacterium]
MGLSREEFRAALVSRHGEACQAKFDVARVAVCGLGGLGSNIAIALARAGVGHLHLIDFDMVEPSNLNRQQYTLAQIGQPKAQALADTLATINPWCDVKSEGVRLTPDNLATILADDPIVCEAFDRAEAKAMLVAGVLGALPRAIVVAASGMASFRSANAIVTRRVSKRLYLCGDGVSDVGDGDGLLGARVAVCAAHQATMVLRLVAGFDEP